jgi:hypothetical protein
VVVLQKIVVVFFCGVIAMKKAMATCNKCLFFLQPLQYLHISLVINVHFFTTITILAYRYCNRCWFFTTIAIFAYRSHNKCSFFYNHCNTYI